MSSSDRFYSYMRNLRKKRRELDTTSIREEIERSFHTCMAGFTEPLRYDLLYHFMDAYAPETADESQLLDASDVLLRVIDLFEMQYESAEDELSDADWIAIRQSIDDNAHDLDTGLMTYIMRHVLKRGLIR